MIISRLKVESRLFKSCYETTYYTGSYYESLRITSPEEYDLNLVLNLPFNKEKDLEVTPLDNTYATFSLTSEFDCLMNPKHDRYGDYK